MEIDVARALLVILVAMHVSGCAAYRIESTSQFDARQPDLQKAVERVSGNVLSIDKINAMPEGAHCFEPLLYVLSIGMIPTHCVDRYHVGLSPVESDEGYPPSTDFTVTLMQGWVALMLPLFPDWKFGYGERVEDEMRCRSSGEC